MAALFAVLALAACGGGDYVTPATPEPVKLSGVLGDPVVQTVGAAGGAVDVTTLGVTVHLSFPAGAVTRDTVVKITPVTPAAGDFVSLRLEPGSLVFVRPVTVTMALPAGVTPDALASLRQDIGGAGAYAPTVVDRAARTLSATLVTFGGANPKPLAAAAPDRRHAQHAGRQDAPPPDPSGTLSAQQRLEIQQQVTAARASIADLQSRGLFIAAVSTQQQIAGLLMRSGEDGYIALAAPFLNEAHDTACRERAAAITRSKTATIAAWGDYKPVVSVIMYWDSLAMRLGGTACDSGSATDVASDVVKREFDLVNAGLRSSSNPAQIAQPASDVRSARELKSEARALQSTGPAASAVRAASGRARVAAAGVHPAAIDLSGYASLLQTELLDPAVMPARQSAWTAAKTGATLAQYADLLDAFGPTAVLQQDVQFVRTRIDVQSSDSTGAAVAGATLGFAALPDAPADPVPSATVAMRSGGSLQVSGSVAALECDSASGETLKVTFENAEVASVSGSGPGLLAGAVGTLTTSGLLSAAGLAADDQGTHTLRIQRTGSACATALGISDDTLAVITLDFAQPPMTVQVFFARGVVGDGIVSPGECGRATDLSFPFSFAFGPCAGATGSMTLALSDPRTIVWSAEAVVPNDSYFTGWLNVTFSKAGTVTLSVNPAWLKSHAGCGLNNFYGLVGHAVLPFAAGLTGGAGSLTPWAKYDVCSNPNLFGPNLDSTSLAVAAGQTLGFYVATLNNGFSSMTGSGTAFTWHLALPLK